MTLERVPAARTLLVPLVIFFFGSSFFSYRVQNEKAFF